MSSVSTDDRIAIVSVSYGSAAELATMLASIDGAARVRPVIAIADNLPSVTGTADVVASEGGLYVPLPSNPGYGGAINAVVSTLPPSVEHVLVTNPDVAFHAGAIDRLSAELDRDPGLGSVGPLVREPDGSVYPSAREVPGVRSGVGHALFVNTWRGNPWTRKYHSAAEYSAPRDAGWLSGSCVLVRRSAFDEVGGFDERFFMYFEDVDLGYRLGKAGWRNRYLPTAEVTHTGGHSTSGESAAMVRAHHRSAELFISTKYQGARRAPVRWAILAGLRVRSVLAERRARRG